MPILRRIKNEKASGWVRPGAFYLPVKMLKASASAAVTREQAGSVNSALRMMVPSFRRSKGITVAVSISFKLKSSDDDIDISSPEENQSIQNGTSHELYGESGTTECPRLISKDNDFSTNKIWQSHAGKLNIPTLNFKSSNNLSKMIFLDKNRF